jgi:hypothetical protein
MMSMGGAESVVLPVREKETDVPPNFFQFMEDEYDGDYSAARAAYYRKYRVDPSVSSTRQLR